MKKEIPKHSNDLDRIGALENENYRLEEENKELKSELDYVRTIKESAEERIKELEEENKKLKEEIGKLGLHINAKDEAYMKLLKDYEELKESSKTKEETLINAIGDIFNKLKD